MIPNPQTLIHLTYQVGTKWLIACLGDNSTEYRINGVVKTHPNYQFSGDVRAVTCPECRKVAESKKLGIV